MTAGERSFLNRELLKSPNFVAGSVLMFGVGMILSGTLALMPSMMQVLLNYPVFDAGWMMAPRGFGTMLAMFIVARMINRVDNRLFILVGFLMTAASLWQMTGYSLYMGSGPILWAGFAQGFGLGCTFVPLNLLALSGLPHHILTQGTALRALMRMLGGSIGIAILETQLTQNTQIVHSRLMEHLRPDNPLAQSPYLSAPFSLTDPVRDRRPQPRSHPPGRDDRLHRRFRLDAVRHPRLPAAIAAGPRPAPPADAGGGG